MQSLGAGAIKTKFLSAEGSQSISVLSRIIRMGYIDYVPEREGPD